MSTFVRSLRSLRSLRVPPWASSLLAGSFMVVVVGTLLQATHAVEPRYRPVEETDEGPAFDVAPGRARDDGACQIAVRVRAQDAPRPDAQVLLSRVGGSGTREEWRARMDERGAHRFLDLPVGSYDLTVDAAGAALQGASRVECTTSGQRAFFDVSLVQATHFVQLQVRGDDRRPLALAEVAIGQEERSRAGLAGIVHVRTDSAGQVTVALPAGRYQLLVQAEDHVAQRRSIVLDGADVRASVTLPYSPMVRGVVVDETGNPLASALVSMGAAWAPGARASSVHTDEAGRFSLPVQRDQDLFLTARGDGKVARLFVGNVGDGRGLRQLRLVASPGRSVEGLVLRSDGGPHAFGAVHYRVRALGLEGVEPTDGDGRFVLDGMPANEDVEVWADGTAVGAWGAAVATPADRRLALTYVPPAY